MLQFDTQGLLPWNEADWQYVSRRAAGDVPGTLLKVSRYSLGAKEAARSNGVYLSTDETLTFALDLLDQAGITPKPRDLVTPPGEAERVVLSATPHRFLKFWSLVVRDLALTYDLRDRAAVRRSNPAPDAGGLRVRNPTDPHADVPCRLQPEEWTRELSAEGMGRVTTRRRYTAFLGRPLLLEAGDTLVVGGVEYEAAGQSDVSQFDTLTRVACERSE